MDSINADAEFTKINFILENLYALVLRELGASHEDVPPLAEEILRQASLPGTTYGPEASDEELDAMRELANHRIAMFFAAVERRMASDRAR